jgi:hypothetical protein
MKYEELPPITHDQLEQALAGQSAEDAAVALLEESNRTLAPCASEIGLDLLLP